MDECAAFALVLVMVVVLRVLRTQCYGFPSIGTAQRGQLLLNHPIGDFLFLFVLVLHFFMWDSMWTPCKWVIIHLAPLRSAGIVGSFILEGGENVDGC